ncbi:class I tRNA ligase family protein [Patescibacteria group bacterium]|nr:class I tRNA ligase family protein [Patescibacteria group bacterium]
MKKYDHKKIEKKWQAQWEKDGVVKIDKDDQSKEKFYMLDMFPYPSGDGLHMGHTESYTASDVFYRFKKMNGFNVLHPQGFDSFGLPAENYAIKTGIHPLETTQQNIATYISQMKSLGLNYDFDEKVVTSEPEYYRWTQWLFGKFFENDLVYKKTSKINWCESCQTGIANEQVVGGECERCGTQIVLKEIPGWFFKITNFADALIDDLEKVDWPEHTKKNQINWIGKSEGAEINFLVKSQKSKVESKIKVFTTRPDTLFGATYMVLAPEHNLVQELKEQITNWDKVEKYISDTQRKSEMDRIEGKEKTGVKLEGVMAINPANKQEIPVFIADYVLAGYGTGAIMAVPAHDERDFEFATKFGIDVKEVIAPYLEVRGEFAVREDNKTVKRNVVTAIVKDPKADKFLMLKNLSGNFFVIGGVEGDDFVEEAKREVLEETGYKNLEFIKQIGGELHNLVFAKHKDENRYGINKCLYFELKNEEKDEIVKEELIKHKSLWVTKEEVNKFLNQENQIYYWKIFNEGESVYIGSGKLINSREFDGLDSEEAKQKITEFVGGELTTNYRLRDWSISRQRYWGCPIPIVYSPEGEAQLIPEEHLPWVLPVDVDFKPTGTSPLADSKELKERTEKIFGKGWTPEFDTMDTFVDSSWYYLRYPDVHNDKEFCSESRKKYWLPVDLYIGGAEHTYMHLLFSRFFVKAMKKIGLLDFDEPFMKLRHQGMVLDSKGKKMSKSKGNVINPNDMVERFGADSVRAYMLFAAPLEDEVMWNEDNIVGVYRFLEKIFKYTNEWVTFNRDNEKINLNKEIDSILHKTIKKVSEDIENLKYNTAVSSLMIFVNKIREQRGDTSENQLMTLFQLETFLKILAPFAPHITEEIWENLGNEKSIHLEEWPKYDEKLAQDEKHLIAIQINGKVRSEIEIEDGEDEESIKNRALEDERVKKWLEEKEVKKAIYIKNRLLNLVI